MRGNISLRAALVFSVAAALFGLAAGTANAAVISIDGVAKWQSGTATLGGTFDASGSDKLVVIVTGEHGFNQSGSGWAGDVFYDGVQLTAAVKRQPIKASADPLILVDDTYNAIYYLDNPGSVHVGGIITTSGFQTRGNVGVIGLSGTAAGVGNTVIGARDTNTAVLTTAADSIVIGSYGLGGTGNTAQLAPITTPGWDAQIARQENGNNWDGHVVAYKNGVAAGTTAYTFADTTVPGADGRTGRHVIAVEFMAFGAVVTPLNWYWDIDGVTPGAGGVDGDKPFGTWDATTTANWNASSDGTGASETWTAGCTAIFAAGGDAIGAYTVTVDGTQDIVGLTFEEGTVTLSPATGGGALQMTGDTVMDVASGLTATVATPVSEDGAGSTPRQLDKTSDGTLILSGDLSHTGGTVVSGGTLVLSGDNSAATGGTNVGAGTLIIGGSGTLGSDTAPLIVSGGKLDLGGTSQTVGTVSITAAAASGDTVGNGDLTATSYAASNATGTAVVSADLAGSGATMTKTGSGTLLLTGTNTYDGGTTVSAGVLEATSMAALPGYDSAGKVVFNGGTVGVLLGGAGWSDTDVDTLLTNATKTSGALGLDTTNGDVTRTAALTAADMGGLGLAKLGANKLTLDVANTYTGATTVYAGTLTAGAGQTSAFGSAPSLAFGPGSTGKVQLNGNSFTLSSLTTDGGTPVVENGSATPVTLTVNNSAANTFAGSLQDGLGGGALSLVKTGDGTLTLSGASSYSGGTVISAGTVVISADNNLGAAGSNLSITGTSRINLVGPLTCTHPIDIGSGVVLSLQNTNSNTIAEFSGAVTGEGGITAIARGGAGDNVTIALTNPNNTFTGPVVTTHSTSTDIFRFASIGDGSIISFGKASWRGWVAYTGSTDLTLNTRQLALGATFGGVLDGMGSPVNAFQNNSTTGTVTINSDLLVPATMTSGTFWFDGSNTGNNTFAGNIPNPETSGTLAIGKWGAGTWILSGTNTYAGATTVRNGTLLINGDNSGATGTVTVSAAGRLGGSGIIGGAVVVSGTLAPGANIGTLTIGTDIDPNNLTMAENSTYEWQNGPAKADKVVVTGDLTLPAVWKLKLMNEGDMPTGQCDLFTFGGSLLSYTAPTVDYGDTGWTIDDVTVEVDDFGRIYLSFGPVAVLGDTNADGVVDAADFITLKKNFGTGAGGNETVGNFDNTGTVDWADLSTLTTNMGVLGAAPATTPEPATLGLLALGVLAVIRRRRRA